MPACVRACVRACVHVLVYCNNTHALSWVCHRILEAEAVEVAAVPQREARQQSRLSSARQKSRLFLDLFLVPASSSLFAAPLCVCLCNSLFVHAEEDAVVDLPQPHELQNLPCLRVQVVKTAQAHDEHELGFGLDVEATLGARVALEAHEVGFLRGQPSRGEGSGPCSVGRKYAFGNMRPQHNQRATCVVGRAARREAHAAPRA